VVFLGGSYTDLTDRRPLVSAAVTELHVPRPFFITRQFFPARFVNINTFGVLFDPVNGRTRLNLLPLQYRSNSPTSEIGTMRRYDALNLRLYYGNLGPAFTTGARLQAGLPVITKVASQAAGSTVSFDLGVIGDPAAGVQEVFITWTDGSGQWQSLPLTQDTLDSPRWTGSLSLSGVNGAQFGFFVQAVSGIGQVAVDDNDGNYFGLNVDTSVPPAPEETRFATFLTLDPPPTTVPFGTSTTFGATLTTTESSGSIAPFANQVVTFQIGDLHRSATTGADGRASVTVPLELLPSSYTVSVSYGGIPDYSASTATATTQTTVTRLGVNLTLTPASATVAPGADSGIFVSLIDASGSPLFGANIYFLISDGGLTTPQVVFKRTDFLGSADLGALNLPLGTYTVRAYFTGAIPPPVGTTLDDPFYTPPAPAQTSLTIQAASTAPQITSQPVTSAVQGQPYSYDVNASGEPAPTYSLVSAPAGMTINTTTGLINWTPTVLPGSYPVTVQAANSGGTATQQFSIAVARPATVQPVSPVLECVVDRGAGWSNPATRYLARFGYQNRNTFQVEILVSSSNNKFTPTPFNRGQPTVFLPGRVRNTFEVAFDGNNLVWHLSNRTSTASRNSARCSS
jgi:hypothetical protein